eukprot:CAMPEP_0114538880 /NCGR_PEP_ID=MMETSP0109-20121206/30385_1 /TAXON_ID=29199 /ORGANISM="Chlorarachnion reptans, Strain CCCM449" /LENGTH=106 /DNA_ID=CAMNT_0001722941 /DNA_START=1088 /DNA_END=1408 /DNA_ORIENTATION=-
MELADVRPGIIAGQLYISAVNHIDNVVYRHGGFRNVSGEDSFSTASRSWAENALLVFPLHPSVQSHDQQVSWGVPKQLVGLVNLLLAGQEDKDVSLFPPTSAGVKI